MFRTVLMVLVQILLMAAMCVVAGFGVFTGAHAAQAWWNKRSEKKEADPITTETELSEEETVVGLSRAATLSEEAFKFLSTANEEQLRKLIQTKTAKATT